MFIHQTLWCTVFDTNNSFALSSEKGFLTFLWEAQMPQVFLSSYIVLISVKHLYSCLTPPFSSFPLLPLLSSFVHQYWVHVSYSWVLFLPCQSAVAGTMFASEEVW